MNFLHTSSAGSTSLTEDKGWSTCFIKRDFYTETRTWLSLVCTQAEGDTKDMKLMRLFQTFSGTVSVYQQEWQSHMCVSKIIIVALIIFNAL